MVIWLNGTFGAGKTSVARSLLDKLPNAMLFDPEQVGFLLWQTLTDPVEDFQDWPPWRTLVIDAVVTLSNYTGKTVIAPQTLLNQSYAEEIFNGLKARGMDVHHFLLDVDEATLLQRIADDVSHPEGRAWRTEHVAPYQAALPWLREAANVIDTSTITAPEAADLIVASLENF